MPGSDSLEVGEDVMDEGKDKSELLEQVRVEGSGIAAGVVMESEVIAGKVIG